MFEVKVIKKSSFEIVDFRGVRDPHNITDEHELRRRLSELGAHTSDILNILSDFRPTKTTTTILISPSRWRNVERVVNDE